MTRLRIGTRGSALAQRQTAIVCDLLCAAHPGLACEVVVIQTQGDLEPQRPFGADFPVGAFVKALEAALLQDTIDVAVHSYKDLPTPDTPGLVVAATPARAAPHDVLLTRGPRSLADLPPRARIGTGSPRRAAQLRRLGDFEIVPLRGNVPTRVGKLEQEGLDGIVLAAAGLARLGLAWPHQIELPLDVCVPAPAQGALAVQTRADDPAVALVAPLDDPGTRCCVTAERAFLLHIQAGCQTPVAALATVVGDVVTLRGQLYTDDQLRWTEGQEQGTDPEEIGRRLAERLRAGS